MRLFTVSGIRKVFNLLREKVMIRQKIFNGIFLAILSLVLISCSPTEENLVNIDPSYMNQQILLKKAGVLNTFKIDDPIFLELYYNTNNVIVFPNNYGLKIYYATTLPYFVVFFLLLFFFLFSFLFKIVSLLELNRILIKK